MIAAQEGNELFPMKQVNIVDENGRATKGVCADRCIMSQAERSTDRLLTMTRVQKSGNDWVDAGGRSYH